MRVADLQIIVPKMTEVAGLQGSENARQMMAAQKSRDSTRAMVEADAREVRAKKDAQAVVMRAGKDREGSGGGARGRRGKDRRNRGGTGNKSITGKIIEEAVHGGSSGIDIRL